MKNPPIAYVDIASLRPGSLYDKFAEGALAVIIDCAGRIKPIWSALLENEEERLPWQGTMRDMASNHYAGSALGGHVGDMFHYTPDRIAYIARKFELSKDGDSANLTPIPEGFRQGKDYFRYSESTINACWEMVEEIMRWLAPAGMHQTNFQAVVHRLKYEHEFNLTQRHFELTKSAIGKWAQLGFDIDRLREQARGPLGYNGISDICAILSLAGPLRRLFERINASLNRADSRRALPEGMRLIGKAHYDGRYFSAMCGARSSIHTQVYDGRQWHEVPMDCNHLLLIPGLQAEKAFRIKPTLHRILHLQAEPNAEIDLPFADVTLLLGCK